MTYLEAITHPAIDATVEFIQEAHAGQLYGDGPYFLHPVEVADEAVAIAYRLRCNPWDIKTVTPVLTDVVLAALLHDVIEDTKYDADDLRRMYNDDVVEMVELLSKDETLDYKGNIERIIDSGNFGAMMVKLADNRVNYRGDKTQMTPARAEKLMTRYAMSMEMLTAAIDELLGK